MFEPETQLAQGLPAGSIVSAGYIPGPPTNFADEKLLPLSDE